MPRAAKLHNAAAGRELDGSPEVLCLARVESRLVCIVTDNKLLQLLSPLRPAILVHRISQA